MPKFCWALLPRCGRNLRKRKNTFRGRWRWSPRLIRRISTWLDHRDPRLFQVASLLAQHGQSTAAIPLIERVRRAFPQSYDVNYNLALAYLQTAQYDPAAQVLQAFTGPEGKAEAFDLLGSIEEKRAQTEEAERAFGERSEERR